MLFVLVIENTFKKSKMRCYKQRNPGLTSGAFLVTIWTYLQTSTAAETVYRDPVDSYFIATKPVNAEKGIMFESQPNIRLKEDDFLKMFPKLILESTRIQKLDVAMTAANLNEQYQRNPGFVMTEIWWRIEATSPNRTTTLQDELRAINDVNNVFPNTVSTVYLVYHGSPENRSVELITHLVSNLATEIIKVNVGVISIALEIRDVDLSCDDLLLLPTEKLTSITVWLYKSGKPHLSSLIKRLTDCQKQSNDIPNNKNLKIIIRGINTVNGSTTVKNEFSLAYHDGKFRVTCQSDNHASSCKDLKLVHKFVNTQVAIYNFNGLGLSYHPQTLKCDVPGNDTAAWSRAPIPIAKGVGFTLYFDSKKIIYTEDVLHELITNSPVLLIENRYELSNNSAKQLKNFLKQFATFYQNHKTSSSGPTLLTSVAIRLDAYPIESRDETYYTKWTKIALQAANIANKIFPKLVEGLLLRFETESTKAAKRIVKVLKKMKEIREWKPGFRMGLSFPSQINGCLYFAKDADLFDMWVFEYEVNLSLQCSTAESPNIFEEYKEYSAPLVTCKNSVSHIEIGVDDTNILIALIFRVTQCKPKWLTSDDIDIQFALLVQKINILSPSYRKRVYIGSAFEEDALSADSCGWWKISTNTTTSDEPFIENRKTFLRRKWNVDNKGGNAHGILDLLWLWILLPLLVLCLSVIGVSIGVIIIYRHKYLLRYEEITEFFKGKTVEINDAALATENADALASKYDNEKYEIDARHHHIDTSKCLGMGEFGCVYQASITKDTQTITVAVKTTKRRTKIPQREDLVALRGLISEIKILSHIGEHPNIVGLVGAYTEKLKRGYIAVFLEFCSNGSLLKHLRGLGDLLKSNNENVETDKPNIPSDIKDNLLRWSYEIANGMEFMASKHIVHADLATRNVLLDSCHVAKIADFGLSRRMYHYTSYVKKNQEPLPWRWMAPEALKTLQFNEKTDIWAYGVTIWEIYTLGDVPYPGMAMREDFVDLISNGLRLYEPCYGSKELYDIMSHCWKSKAEQRPTFTDIRRIFENKINPIEK